MLESQLQPIHKEIAEMYEEDDTVALSTLAHHWLAAGSWTKGCMLLEKAAKQAQEMMAIKECANLLDQAITTELTPARGRTSQQAIAQEASKMVWINGAVAV